MTKDYFKEVMLKGIFEQGEASQIGDAIFAKKVLLMYLKDRENLEKNIYNINLQEIQAEDGELLGELYGKIQSNQSHQDCRISKMMMHAIRGVGKVDDRTYFGLDCTDNVDNPCSLVLLGQNGIGKTSFYSALEMIGMGKSNCASLRGYSSKAQQAKFMVNVNATDSDGHILIKAADGKVMSLKINDYAEGNDNAAFIAESCYCSDFDLQTLEGYSYNSPENSFTNYLHSQLGMSGFDIVYSIMEKYNDEIVRRAREISDNSTEILDLKNKVFQLLAERAIIERGTNRTPLSSDIVRCFRGDHAKAIADIEGKIILEDATPISTEEMNTLLSHYQMVIGILYDLTYIPIDKCQEYFSSIKESVINGHFYFQTADDLKKSPDLSYLHHECIAVLENALNSDTSIDTLKSHKDSFHKLQDFHGKLKDTIIQLLIRHPLSERRNAIETDLRDLREELITQRMKLSGRMAISMNDYPVLIQQSARLKTFLGQKIVGYDRQIFDILKNVVPALCSKSFPTGKGEKVEINYGDTTQPVFSRPKKFKIGIRVRLTENDDNGNPKEGFEEPGRYLNTFRLKLFCFSLKLALSCCAMKLDGCQYPIMVDDVFDASDFRNRNEICYVMKKLAEQFALQSSGLSPMQLILFSQDEIVAERVYQGLTEAGNHAKLERLVHPENYNETIKSLLKQDLEKSTNPLTNWLTGKDWAMFLTSNDTKRLIEFYRASDNIKQNFPYDSK